MVMWRQQRRLWILAVIVFGIMLWRAVFMQARTRTRQARLPRDVPALAPYTPETVFQHKHVLALGRALPPKQALPRYFKYKEALMVPVRTQGECASCWAFAVCDSMADRISMHTRGQVRKTLSAQELLSCFRPRTFTCTRGGLPEAAFQYVVTRGVLEEAAYPYANAMGGPIPKCKLDSEYWAWEALVRDPLRHERNPHRVYAKEGSVRDLCYPPWTQRIIDRNIENMKTEIFLNGPIVGTIMVYSDLYTYDAESVYETKKGARLIGGHAIEIFGWADAGQNTEEKGFEGAYWICRNSWGDLWPRNLGKPHTGWFYVRMGRNEAGIESRASCAEPLLTQAMQEYGKSSAWASTAYTSYTEYVDDPERVNFFAHLSRTRNRNRQQS
jgi:C1A family cysteine protease